MVTASIWFRGRENGCPTLDLCECGCRPCTYISLGDMVELDLIDKDTITGAVTEIQNVISGRPYVWVHVTLGLKVHRAFVSNVRRIISENDIEFFTKGSMSNV